MGSCCCTHYVIVRMVDFKTRFANEESQDCMQVTPLFQEPLEIPEEVMPKLKAAIMMCIAVVQLVNTRSLVQSYLNSGLRQWHSMKHGPPAGPAGTKTGEVIAFKLRVVSTLLVKVRPLSLSWS